MASILQEGLSEILSFNQAALTKTRLFNK